VNGTVNIAVIGATGYTGQELLKILARHPTATVTAVMTARPNHTPPPPALPVDAPVDPLDLDRLDDVDGVFLCTPHGAAAPLVQAAMQKGIKIVDLSADFRLQDQAAYQQTYGQEHPAPELLAQAVYGLTEHYRAEIRSAQLVANPGCYPTCILLGLKPLLDHNLVAPDATIVADCKSGVSGAGKQPGDRNVYGAVAQNFLAYGVGSHRHGPEIRQQAGTDRIVFVPHLLPMFRGMLATIYVSLAAGSTADDARSCLREVYANADFVRVYDRGQPEVNRVQHTNYADLAVADAGVEGQVVLTAAIDNLGKGAAGQAMQNMNLMLGLDEEAGLS